MTPQVGIKLGIDGTAKVEGDLKRVSLGLDGVGKAGAAAAGMLASLGAGISIAGLVAFVRNAVDAADEMSKLSQRTGIAVKDIAGLQLAFQQSGLSAGEFGDSMARMSRNMVDNAKAFEAMGVKTRDASGKLRSVREVLGDVADKFASYEDGAGKVALANEIIGRGADRMIPLLNGGSEALAEFDATAQRLGLTMDETAGKQAEKFNDTMDLIGMGVQGTARKIAGELLPTMVGLASQFLENMNTGDGFRKVAEGLSVALRGLYIVGIGVVQAFSAVGKTLGAAAGVIASVLKGDFAAARAIMGELRADLTAGITTTLADMSKAWNAASSPAVVSIGKVAAAMGKAAPVVENGARKVAKAAKEIKDAFSEAAAKAFTKAMEDFGRISSDASAKAEGLTKTQARLRDVMADPTWARFSRQQQEQVIVAAAAAEAADEWAQAQEAARKSMADAAQEIEEYNNAQRSVVEDAIAEATAAEESLRNYGLLRSEVERLKLAKLEEARESAALAGEDVSNLERRIAAQRRLVDAVNGMELKEASTAAAKHAADEWQKATDQINQSLTDALMRGFESGKGFAQSLKDSVVAMFKTMVLRPIVQAIVQPIAGPIAQGLSSFLPGMGGMGGIGQAAGAVSSGIGYAGMLGQGVGALFGQTAGNAALGTAMGLGAGSAQAAAVAATQAAGAATAATGTMAALGSTIATAIPYVGAALMVASLFSKDRGGPKVDGHAGFTASNIGVMSRDRSLSPMIATSVQQLQTQYAQIARALGGDSGAIRFGMGVTTDPSGTAPSFLDVTGANRAGAAAFSMQSWNVGRSNEDLQAAIAQFVATATIEGLKNSDLAPQYRAFLDSVASGASTEIKQAAVQTLVEVQRFTSAVKSMGAQFGYVADMSVEARKRIIDLAGGIDTLAAGIANYAQNFLNPDEQRQMLANSLAETLRAGFINISADQLLSYSRDTIREWVNGLDLTTAQGQQVYAALMANSEQLGQMVGMNEQAAQAMQDASAGISDAARAMEEAAREQARQLATYRSAFLTRDEQRAILAEELSASLSASFINAPTEFLMGYQQHDIRNWVESLDQTSEVGKRVFAGIMANIDALAQMVEMNEEAADEAAAAFKEMQDSAQQFREAVKSVGQTIQDEIDRLRGGTKTGSESLDAMWARFATTTGQARAGDLDAAGRLTSLSQSIEEAIKGSASSRSEVDAVREQLAGSLDATTRALTGLANRGLVPVAASPAVQPGTATPTQPAATQTGGDLVGTLKNIAEETSMQQQQLTALMNRLTTTITRWDTDGLPEERVLA